MSAGFVYTVEFEDFPERHGMPRQTFGRVMLAGQIVWSCRVDPFDITIERERRPNEVEVMRRYTAVLERMLTREERSGGMPSLIAGGASTLRPVER